MNESITGTSRPRSSHIGRRFGIIACIVALMTCWIGSASAETGTFHQKNDPWFNVAIPDNGGWTSRVLLQINVSGIPANAKITSVKYTCWVDHPFRGDLCVDLTAHLNNQWVSHAISDRSGGLADNIDQTETFTTFNGGCREAVNNPSPTAKAVNTFNPNGEWYLVAWDNASGDTGALDGLEIWINWETPVPEMDVKGNGSPIADGDSTPSTGDGTDFGQTPQGTSVERTFWVYNTGGAALTPETITVPNGYTLTVGLISSIAPGGSDYFKVRLNATASDTFAGDISIPNNDPNENPYNFRVTGTVFIPPEMAVKGNGVSIADGDSTPSTSDYTDFGDTDPGIPVERTFWVYNTGGTALIPGTITVPSGYTLTVGLISSIAPGWSDYFKVRLDATSPGTYEGDIRIPNNDPNENPFNFRIKGVVVDQDITRIMRLSGDLAFGNVQVGQSVQRIMAVYNDGNSGMTVSSISCPTGFSASPSSFALAAGGNSPVTITFSPTLPQPYGGTITVNSNKTSGTNAILCSGTGFDDSPRSMRVADTSGSPGGTVEIPIRLASQGDENTLGFSLTFDPALLSNPQVTLGTDATGATLLPNSTQVGQGLLGIGVGLPGGQHFVAGTREIAVVTFTVASGITQATTTPVGFGDTPIAKEIVNVSVNPVSAGWVPGTVTIGNAGYEADTAPRPSGNSVAPFVSMADWAQAGRFAAGLDTAASGGEFQRADCAPRATFGDGRISVADWAQAGRYAAGLDLLTPAAGPTARSQAQQAVRASQARASVSTATRTMGVIAATGTSGGTVTVPVQLVSQGDENTLGFSLTFDPALLSNPQVTLGTDATGATLLPNSTQVGQGLLGIGVGLQGGQHFVAGNREVAVVTFTVAPGIVQTTTTPISFGDTPIAKEIVDVEVNVIAADWLPGVVTIVGGSGKQDQSITFPALPAKTYGDADFAPGATASSGLAVTYASGNLAVATIVGGNVHIVGAGTATITASQSGNGSWNAATPVAKTLTVANLATTRTMGVVAATGTSGGTVTVPVQLVSQGDENTLGFSLAFDPALLSNPQVTLGADATGATLLPNSTQVGQGLLGIGVGLQGGQHFVAGTREVAVVTFTVAPGIVQTTTTPISFGDTPIAKEIVDVEVNVIAADWLPGVVTIVGGSGKQDQSITFPALPAKTYGDADFAPGATASSGLAVTYASGNLAVATIAGGNVHIVGAGTATITASQSGNGSWNAATPRAQTLTVAKKALTATADNKTRSVGQANPAFTIAYTGLVTGDTAAVLDTPPTALCSATATSAAETYPITVSGGSDANYAFSYVAGTLTITPVDTVTVSVSATPANGGTVSGGGTKNSGSSFTVVATATSGYRFSNWTESGVVVSPTASYTFTGTSNRGLVANFAANTVTVSVSATPTNGGTVSGGGTKTSGSSFTVTATKAGGYVFSGWTKNGAVISTRASYTFTATASSALVAVFTAELPAPLDTVSTAFAGTVTVAANWVDFSALDADDTNCNDWMAFPVTYNAYLVLCYGEILCPVCPFPITDAWLWLVDKKGKQVFAASLEDGGITDAQGYCFGNGNVGVTFATFLPYADLEGLTGVSYTTSPAVTFALAGTRAKVSSKAAVNILQLTGGATLFAVSPAENANQLAALECEDGSELAFVTASFKKSGAKVKPDPYCPECATNCDSVYATQLAAVAKAAKKYFWWDILGEGDVQPVVK